MRPLPSQPDLPIHHLAAAFNDVTNSYKFLWFLGILDEVETEATRTIPVSQILARTVAATWYPVNYFRINFGKQDALARLVMMLMEERHLMADAHPDEIIAAATQEINARTNVGIRLQNLGRYVPYSFIRPFFADSLQGVGDATVNSRIAQIATERFTDPASPSLYRFVGGTERLIEVNPVWYAYLLRHTAFLRGYTYWHLLNYLQQRNASVPNLASKLFPPRARNLARARHFWKIVFARGQSLHCIYSGQVLDSQEYSLDHFLPWRFVAHDSLWNLVPTPKHVNSAKGDRLPEFSTYFEGLAQLQFNALHTVLSHQKDSRLLEDYVFLLNAESVAAMRTLSYEQFRSALRATLAPQVQIAINLGFQSGWTY